MGKIGVIYPGKKEEFAIKDEGVTWEKIYWNCVTCSLSANHATPVYSRMADLKRAKFTLTYITYQSLFAYLAIMCIIYQVWWFNGSRFSCFLWLIKRRFFPNHFSIFTISFSTKSVCRTIPILGILLDHFSVYPFFIGWLVTFTKPTGVLRFSKDKWYSGLLK